MKIKRFLRKKKIRRFGLIGKIKTFFEHIIKPIKIFFLATTIITCIYFVVVTGKIIFSSCSQTCKNMFKPETFLVKTCNVNAPSIKQEIIYFTAQKIKDKNTLFFSPQTICQELEQTCDLISHIAWKMPTPNHLLITIESTIPTYHINGMIMGDTRKLLSPELFEGHDVKNLRTVWVHDAYCTTQSSFPDVQQKSPHERAFNAKIPKTLDPLIYDFLEKIPTHLYQQFGIAYHSPSKIILTPRKTSAQVDQPLLDQPPTSTSSQINSSMESAPLDYYVVADEKNLLDREKIKTLALVEKNMQKKECDLLQKINFINYQVAYDIRFENRVIVKMFRKNKSWRGK
ncbi:MAG: hypothetical protein V1855_02830 [bacterium]